jgi:hypothetical protein
MHILNSIILFLTDAIKVINAGGLESAAYYPYTGEDGVCAFNKSAVAAKIKNWAYVSLTLY